MKTCTRCKIQKPESEFGVSYLQRLKKNRVESRCKQCRKERSAGVLMPGEAPAFPGNATEIQRRRIGYFQVPFRCLHHVWPIYRGEAE